MPKSSFFSPRRLALLAMLTAASIVLSRLCVIYLTPTLRVEFGNLPIFLAGLFLGPASGVIVGGLADVLGATLSGVVYCPPLTLAAMFIGLLAGLQIVGAGGADHFLHVVALLGGLCGGGAAQQAQRGAEHREKPFFQAGSSCLDLTVKRPAHSIACPRLKTCQSTRRAVRGLRKAESCVKMGENSRHSAARRRMRPAGAYTVFRRPFGVRGRRMTI